MQLCRGQAEKSQKQIQTNRQADDRWSSQETQEGREEDEWMVGQTRGRNADEKLEGQIPT